MTALDQRGRALALLLALIVLVPASAWTLAELGIRPDTDAGPSANPAYPTQGNSREAVREAYLRNMRAETQDHANEACGAQPTAVMAARLGTAPDPSAIATAFAERHYEVSLRRSAYAGCLSGIVTRSR